MSANRRRLTDIERWDIRRQLLTNVCEGYPLGSVIDAIVKKFATEVFHNCEGKPNNEARMNKGCGVLGSNLGARLPQNFDLSVLQNASGG